MKITPKSRQISALECQWIDQWILALCVDRRRASPLLPRLPVRVRCNARRRRIDINFAIDGKSGHRFHRRGISTRSRDTRTVYPVDRRETWYSPMTKLKSRPEGN